MQVRSTKCLMSLARARTESCVRPSIDQVGERSQSRRSPRLIIRCFVSELYGSSNYSNSSANPVSVKMCVLLLFPCSLLSPQHDPHVAIAQIISILDIIRPTSLEAFKEVYCACVFTFQKEILMLTSWWCSNSRTYGDRHAPGHPNARSF